MPRTSTTAVAAAMLAGALIALPDGAVADPAHGAAAAGSLRASPASTADSALPIPGLVGGGLSVGGVARVGNGGALIAASTRSHAHSPWQLAIARLRLDGTADLAYGVGGIARPIPSVAARASAIAIDPRSGAAWIGAAAGSGHGEIVALTPNGTRARKFGRRGVLQLPAALSGTPVGLAWRRGELVVAAGGKPCPGCVVGAIDPASGAVRKTVSLAAAPTPPASEDGCRPASVSGVALARSMVLLTAGTRPVEGTAANAGDGPARSSAGDNGGAGCSAQLLRLHDRSLAYQSAVELEGAKTATLASAEGQTCIAESSHAQTAFGSLTGSGAPGGLSVAPAGSVIEAVPLGAGACAALIAPARGGAVVAQGRGGNRRSSITALPRAIRPLGVSRCQQHLLTIGARQLDGAQQGVVAVIPVRAGPHARGAAAAALQCRSTL